MWIDVDKEMPEDEEQCLFLLPFSESILGVVEIGYFLDGDWVFRDSNNTVTDYVSHWMKIPDTAVLIDKINEIK